MSSASVGGERLCTEGAMGDESLAGKARTSAEGLSPRDKALCDAFLSGTSRKALAEQFKVTVQRVGQILNHSASVAYLVQRGTNTRALIFSKVGEEILARTEWGGVRLSDLLAIWKAAMPQEVTITHRATIQKEAERLASEMGLTVEEVLAEAERIMSGAP